MLIDELRDQITVVGAPPSWRVRRTTCQLLDALRATGSIPRKAKAVLSISFVGQTEMARLNGRYRGKRRPTDILSFEQQEGRAPRGLVFLGDLVLCVPVLRDQARGQGHGVRAETAVLLAHGLLHLLGYDHERSERDDRLMLKAETRLLKAAGLGLAGLIGRGKL